MLAGTLNISPAPVPVCCYLLVCTLSLGITLGVPSRRPQPRGAAGTNHSDLMKTKVSVKGGTGDELREEG